MNTTFMKYYNAIEATIEFDISWKNDTGYLDDMAEINPSEYGIEFGTAATFVDDVDRKGIFLATSVGNIILFERYAGDGLIVCHVPQSLDMLISNRIRDDDDIDNALFGLLHENGIGIARVETKLRQMFQAAELRSK